MSALAKDVNEFGNSVTTKLHLLIERPLDRGASIIEGATEIAKFVAHNSADLEADLGW